MPRRIRVWFNDHGEGWLAMGDLCLLDDRQLAVFPASAEDAGELTDLVQHFWPPVDRPARRAFARIMIAFAPGAARHVLAEPTTGDLIEEDRRWAG
jgi:hypothetical protein